MFYILTDVLFNILPIEIRIKTRLINIIPTVLYKSTPHYLTDVLHFKTNLRSLRNSNTYILPIPNIYRKQHGGKSFRYSAAVIWNSLHYRIRRNHVYSKKEIINYYNNL